MTQKIALLDQSTINKIAAGEVVERPAAVVKELVENAIDSGANAITVEIKEGGTTFIRITDNGSGMEKEDVKLAFLPHATSKIRTLEDLLSVTSLGFRGEALSSISSVAQVEIVTKTKEELIGCRYVIEGGEEKIYEEVGCPEGTTFLVRNLFYNTPARRKFLKSPVTEAGYISDLVERLSVSKPNISFKFVNNNQIKLHTSGNHNLKDIIYHVYGREITAQLLEINSEKASVSISGFIGKPIISRGNRNYMNYFMNGRYIKSDLINKAIEEAYKPYTMSHKYPFTVLSFKINSQLIDVNVHPAKMEIRFMNPEEIYADTTAILTEALKGKELIPEVSIVPSISKASKGNEKKESSPKIDSGNTFAAPEPSQKVQTEKKISYPLLEDMKQGIPKQSSVIKETNDNESFEKQKQMTLFEHKLLSPKSIKKHRIIGQLFSTYWIVEFEDKMYLIDQHAAHEKVLYESTITALKNKEFASQMLKPPIVLSLGMREIETVEKYRKYFEALGFEIEPFGDKEYTISAVPSNLFGLVQKEVLMDMIDDMVATGRKGTPDDILEKIASMSCKAAIKGNHSFSLQEAEELIKSLLSLENPYHCPHGRPTIIAMSKYEIEKKFKRIVSK